MLSSLENTRVTHSWIAGYPLYSVDSAELRTELYTRREQRRKTLLFFANANLIVQCLDLRRALLSDDVIIVNDGIAMEAANRIINGERFRENLNGTDFIPHLFRYASKPFNVFLYGSTPAAVTEAARVITAMGQCVVGFCDGYQTEQTQVLAAINNSAADIVLVALGNPRQEQWILQHARELSPPLFAGVGALFDFMSGNVQRAPQWLRRLHLEWLYRLWHEPRRLGKRYTIDIAKFFALCWRQRRKNYS